MFFWIQLALDRWLNASEESVGDVGVMSSVLLVVL